VSARVRSESRQNAPIPERGFEVTGDFIESTPNTVLKQNNSRHVHHIPHASLLTNSSASYRPGEKK